MALLRFFVSRAFSLFLWLALVYPCSHQFGTSPSICKCAFISCLRVMFRIITFIPILHFTLAFAHLATINWLAPNSMHDALSVHALFIYIVARDIEDLLHIVSIIVSVERISHFHVIYTLEFNWITVYEYWQLSHFSHVNHIKHRFFVCVWIDNRIIYSYVFQTGNLSAQYFNTLDVSEQFHSIFIRYHSTHPMPIFIIGFERCRISSNWMCVCVWCVSQWILGH